jgi:hypothetical protein
VLDPNIARRRRLKPGVGQTKGKGVNEQLVATLRSLKTDPAAAVELYEQLFRARYWVLVSDAETNLDNMFFLNYESDDGVQELPVFTTPDRHLIHKFDSEIPPPTAVQVPGPRLWPRLLLVLEHANIQVAVDAGEGHGVRLTRPMILGMVSKYGEVSNAT